MKLKPFPILTTAITAILITLATTATIILYEPPEPPTPYEKTLTREILDESLNLGTQFLLNNQKLEGNFNYEYDFINRSFSEGDNQVRQAGALWGIALIHKENPSQKTLDAVLKGLAFFDNTSKEIDNKKIVMYPGDTYGKSGTIALVALSLIEFLQADFDIPNKEKYEADLDKYLNFLLSLRTENGQFYSSYAFDDGHGKSKPSPYFDGESLLALSKAAKYMGYHNLEPLILESAEKMYKINVKTALKKDPDSNTTKGFYQWGSMSFYEIYTSEWKGTKRYADYTIDLAYWMIDVHKTLKRPRNTAYAYEGLISAWELARIRGNDEAMEKIGKVIDIGLRRLTTWQVYHSVQNIFLQDNPTSDSFAIGGIMNKRNESTLRIDVTQHQMHAVILARKFIYKD